MSENDYLLIRNYELKGDIGEGNFGKVKLGIFKKTGEEFAIKIINKEKMKKKMKNKIFNENEIITRFNHINIIYVFQIIDEENDIYIVMEYCNKGELFDYIVSHKKLDENEASIFFYQLINGVDYIHKKGVAHRDLKPENLLLTSDKTLKIIDFGLSHEYKENSLLKTKCGSPSYASPEIVMGQLYDGFKVDIWCCGIILYAMLCGYLPFEGDNNKELFSDILKCNPEYPSFLSEKSKNLIQSLLKIHPEERLTIEQIKNTEFYLNGKKLCKIDYKLVEDELEKRETFYGDGEKKFKNLFKINNNINDEKKEEYNDIVSKNNDNGYNLNKKINLLHLNTDINNNGHVNDIKQQILKQSNFQKKVEILNKKLDKFLQTESNEINNLKNYHNLIDKKNNLNLFNYKNKNITHLLGKQNIYEERFQNKNNGCIVYLKKNNKNSINSIEDMDKTSHKKSKKLLKQFVTPTSERLGNRKKIISPLVNDFSNNYLNKYKRTETISLDKQSNNLSPNNYLNRFITKALNMDKKINENYQMSSNLFDKINLKKINGDENQKNKSIENKLSNIIYTLDSDRNISNESHKYYSNNKNPKYNYNQKSNDNATINSVTNNINVIWKNNFEEKVKNHILKSSSNKNYKRNNNYKENSNKFDNSNNCNKKEYIPFKTENKELFKNNKYNYINNKSNIKALKTIENIDKAIKENILSNNKINYRSKSRDNEKINIIKKLKEKFNNKTTNKNILPPLDLHMK